MSGRNRKDDLDIDRRRDGQGGYSNRGSGVPPRLSEDRDEQLAGAIDHTGLTTETRRAGDETHHLDDPYQVIDTADDVSCGRDRVERAQPRELVRFGLADVRPDESGRRQLAVDERQLAAGPDEVVVPDRGKVSRDRGGH